MNIELKPIAESKIRQLGGDVCGVLVRTEDGVMAVSEHGRCTRLDAGVMGPVEPAGMSDRDEFEKQFSVPLGVKWCERQQDYTYGNYRALDSAASYSGKWQAWQAARAQSGQEVEPVDGQWLIQMRGDYLTTRGVWERPDHRGYTNDIHEAGRYSEADAKEAERMMPDKCKAVRLPVIYRQPAQQGSVPEEWKDAAVGAKRFAEDPKMVIAQPMTARAHIRGMADLILSAPTKPQPKGDGWIKCSERLPTEADADTFGNVWCSGFWDNPNRGIAPINWSNVGKGAAGDTHWMPTGLKRPQPPKEGE